MKKIQLPTKTFEYTPHSRNSFFFKIKKPPNDSLGGYWVKIISK
ncbi:hypothetical protein [Riemerella anatipestifer]|nr:hypothetical protein [Riemerella anatipestifer]